MFMPISKLAKVASVGLILLLGACVEQQATAIAVAEADDASDGGVEVRRVELQRAGNTVAITPPRGFCIDPQNAHEGAVVAGSCAALGVEVQQPAGVTSQTLVMMTASVSEASVPGDGRLTARVEQLEAFLQTGRMNDMLAEDQGVARLIETRLRGDTVYALVEDNEATAFAGASKRFWRVMSEENGRMIVLTVRALEEYWPGEQALLDRAVAFRESIRRANVGAA